ncbi:hypothetical protein Ddye_031389 [Dipteronia dyeriana]|uniref:GDSL esterase/lipase n=1 Tax=Dipteronia dyeriana TaxID=168575 RepID=A0AAD9TIV3_9ROSI|nr:hypothetical protein Ddye_031389 [Dipteronia dyeriana]
MNGGARHRSRWFLLNQLPSSYIRNSLPRPDDFSKALYTFDIGQNDLQSGLKLMTEEPLKESVSGITNRLVQAVETLYQHGARAYWIHNTAPIGCLPHSIIYYPLKHGNTDKNGCIISHNEVAQEFNRLLKYRVVSQLSCDSLMQSLPMLTSTQ